MRKSKALAKAAEAQSEQADRLLALEAKIDLILDKLGIELIVEEVEGVEVDFTPEDAPDDNPPEDVQDDNPPDVDEVGIPKAVKRKK